VPALQAQSLEFTAQFHQKKKIIIIISFYGEENNNTWVINSSQRSHGKYGGEVSCRN
jgi:hypothetical protein